MNTKEVADRLVNLCRQGQYHQAHEELYHSDIVSVEPEKAGMPAAQGIDAVKAKTEQWTGSIEQVHDSAISDPIVSGNFFTVSMENDVTFKERGRAQMKEVCVYEVNDGKIVREQFFYNM